MILFSHLTYKVLSQLIIVMVSKTCPVNLKHPAYQMCGGGKAKERHGPSVRRATSVCTSEQTAVVPQQINDDICIVPSVCMLLHSAYKTEQVPTRRSLQSKI